MAVNAPDCGGYRPPESGRHYGYYDAPPGAYSIRFDEKGLYHILTGGAKQDDYYAYNGKTITLQGAIGASATRELTIASVTASQLVTVEHGEDDTATYQSTSTFTR